MTRRDPLFLAQDVIEFARTAVGFAVGRRREELDTDIAFQFASARAIEVVGEAIRQLQPLIGQRYPQVDWRKIIGMRNWLAHAYSDIDLDVVWAALEVDLPQLITQFETIERELVAERQE